MSWLTLAAACGTNRSNGGEAASLVGPLSAKKGTSPGGGRRVTFLEFVSSLEEKMTDTPRIRDISLLC